MEKNSLFKLFTIALLVLMLSVLGGCKDDDTSEPASMTFVDDENTKEFTIDENLNFTTKFIKETDIMSIKIKENQTISSKITEASDVWNNDLTGIAGSMTSTNEFLVGAVDGVQLPISLKYKKSDDDTITAVTVNFTVTNNDYTAEKAQELMSGTYKRKQ